MKTARSVKKPGKSRGDLFFCGIGIVRPSDASLRTIQLLKTCDVIFYIHGDGVKLKPFFDAFCSDVRVYEGSAFAGVPDSKKIERIGAEVCAELERGRRVAYVTYGHPVLFSDGFNMAEYCRKQGVAGRFVSASSSVDAIVSILTERADLAMFNDGYQVGLADHILASREFHRPPGALILFGLDRIVRQGELARLCEKLLTRFAADHPVYGVRCGDGEEADVVESGVLGEVRGWGERVVHMMSLVLPNREDSGARP